MTLFVGFREKAASINPRGYQEEITKKVVGTVVLTRYNNRTYRVDDIMWAKTPQDHFQCRAGESMSFEEYYKYVEENKFH